MPDRRTGLNNSTRKLVEMDARLLGYEKNITSQFGEDGIIEEILNRIGIGNAFCVEFGAWDGKHLSNTWRLWHEQGWGALLIEGDEGKAAQLEKSLVSFSNVASYCAYVGLEEESKLDTILARAGAPQVIDVLSIDIDGNDYYVFESLNAFSARVVLVEFNPTIPPHIELIAPPGNYFGASALSLYKLAKKKNYSLAACTTTNLIFVMDSDFVKLGIEEPALGAIMPTDCLTYVITSFDGTSYLSRQPPYLSMKELGRGGWLKTLVKNRKDGNLGYLENQVGTILPVSIKLRPR